jgi:hypothetical protein
MKSKLAEIQKAIDILSDKIFLLQSKTDEFIEATWHERVTLPLKDIEALAENAEYEKFLTEAI